MAARMVLLAAVPMMAHAALPVNDAPRPVLNVPKATIKPSLLAEPGDPAWARAVELPPMTPSLGAKSPVPPSLKTKVFVLWDPAYLYVRFVCEDEEIYSPVHGRNAPIYEGDAVEVFVDPVGDARQWMELEFNADDDVFQQLFLCTTTEPKTTSGLSLTDDVMNHDVWQFLPWELPGLISKGRRLTSAPHQQDWIVDMAIPAKDLLRRLGLKQFRPMPLRADFLRYKWVPSGSGPQRELLPMNWSPVVLGCPHFSPAAYGYLNLVE